MKIIPRIHTRKGKVIHGSVNAFFEKKVFIPLSEEENFSPLCLVKAGDIVSEGAVIAENKNFSDTALHAKLHASVPGVIDDVCSVFSPNGKKSECVSIRLQGSFSYGGKKHILFSFDTVQSELLPAKIAQLGIINTFETLHASSLANDIVRAKKAAHRVLVVRLYDEDPDRLTDSLLFELFPEKIKNGATILAEAIYADAIIFAVDEKKSDKIQTDETNFSFSMPHTVLPVNIENYPNGFKAELLRFSKKKLHDEPFSFVGNESLFVDSTTLVNTARALERNMPCIEQYVYVSGDCIPTSALLKVRLGTTMKHLADQCGGFRKPLGMIIVNGSLLGSFSRSLDAGVTKYVKSVIFLSKKHVRLQCIDTCNGCGKCRDVCPRNLSPDILWRVSNGGASCEREYLESSAFCSSCALCNYVCPARLPLCQSVENLKKQMQEETRL